jgi:hypothetical protein
MMIGAAGLVLSVGSTAGLIRAGRRTPRQERRDDLSLVADRQDKELDRQGRTIERLETKVEVMEQALVEQKRQCTEERKEDRRVITSLARILRTVYRHMDALAVPDPVLDPEDVNVLEEYHIR